MSILIYPVGEWSMASPMERDQIGTWQLVRVRNALDAGVRPIGALALCESLSLTTLPPGLTAHVF